MRLRLIRNATLRLDYAGQALLVDPSLDPAGAWEPIPGILNPQLRNPVAELPEPPERTVDGLDGVLLSHRHVDHWDETARWLLPKALPLACQPSAVAPLHEEGFRRLHPCRAQPSRWLGIELTAAAGHHSNGPSRELLAPVAGFVLRSGAEPTLMIAGDSVWCPELAEELDRHRPDVVVVNAGAARQLDGERITMDEHDVAAVLEAVPHAIVVAVHLEAIGHCTLTRAGLREALDRFGTRLRIPQDGESIVLKVK